MKKSKNTKIIIILFSVLFSVNAVYGNWMDTGSEKTQDTKQSEPSRAKIENPEDDLQKKNSKIDIEMTLDLLTYIKKYHIKPTHIPHLMQNSFKEFCLNSCTQEQDKINTFFTVNLGQYPLNPSEEISETELNLILNNINFVNKNLKPQYTNQEATEKLLKIILKNLNTKSRFLSKEELPIIRDKTKKKTFLEEKKIEKNNILYLRFNSFSGKLDKYLSKDYSKYSGLILDLRENSGGILIKIIQFLQRFVEANKTLFYLRQKNKLMPFETWSFDDLRVKIPVVILVDQKTASGATLFTKIMQYYKTAVVIGEKTSHISLVHKYFTFRGGSIGLAIAEFLGPDKESWDNQIVTPDVLIENPKEILSLAIDMIIKKNEPPKKP